MFWFLKKNCPLCTQEGKDGLTRQRKKTQWYCRQHLIEEFKKEFLASSSKMLVCEPNFNICTALYGCYSIAKMPKFYFPKEATQRTAEVISRLDAGLDCRRCQDQAQTIYFDSSYFPILYPKGQGPLVENLPETDGEPLCLKCVLNNLIPLLQSNQQNFNDGGGLYTPYGERCLSVSTYL